MNGVTRGNLVYFDITIKSIQFGAIYGDTWGMCLTLKSYIFNSELYDA